MLRNVLRPGAYHGPDGDEGPYFEGWYYKLVDATGRHRYAVIPGLFLGAGGRNSHAFVQTLDGATGNTTYQRYPRAAFRAHPTEFLIEVGPNRFTADEIALRLDGDRSMTGVLRFSGVEPWPVTRRAPGIMGWYAYVPFMECYHGVLGFDHAIDGMLAVDGTVVDFGGGRGYIEKDWGEAFPQAWIWMQSNHFEEPGVCLTASVARIPWLGSAFRGFIAGLWLRGRLYRFATYTGSRIEALRVAPGSVTWTLQGAQPGLDTGPLRLEIVAHRAAEREDLLHAPYRTAMLQRVLESLTARIELRLSDAQGRVLFQGVGRHAGLELGGDLATILPAAAA